MNGRTLTGAQKLYIHLGFHSGNMEHPSSNKMLGLTGETVLQPTCLSLRAAAGNSMPENRRACSSPKKLPAAFRAGSVVFASKIHTNLFFPARVQAFPSPPAGHEPRRKSPPLPTSAHPTLGCFSVSPPQYWSYFVKEWKSGSLVLVPKSNSIYEKGRKRYSLPLKVMEMEQLFSLWKLKFCTEVTHKNRTYTSPF